MTEIASLFPRWASTWGELARTNALARSQCRCCGMQQRVDLSLQILRFGANGSPIDLRDKCMVVGCHGSVFYMASRTYGRQWIAMTSHGDPRKDSALAVNAISLNLGSTKKA